MLVVLITLGSSYIPGDQSQMRAFLHDCFTNVSRAGSFAPAVSRLLHQVSSNTSQALCVLHEILWLFFVRDLWTTSSSEPTPEFLTASSLVTSAPASCTHLFFAACININNTPSSTDVPAQHLSSLGLRLEIHTRNRVAPVTKTVGWSPVRALIQHNVPAVHRVQSATVLLYAAVLLGFVKHEINIAISYHCSTEGTM